MSNRIISIEQISERGSELISDSEVKNYLKVDYTADDAVINTITKASLDLVEKKVNLGMGVRKLRVIITSTGQNTVRLPYGPVQQITKVEYRPCRLTDWTDVTTEDSWEQEVDTFYGDKGSYRIEYLTGYEELPSELKAAVLAQASYMYEHRGDEEREYVAGGFGLSETAIRLLSGHIQNKIL